jgi:hypothetical protein
MNSEIEVGSLETGDLRRRRDGRRGGRTGRGGGWGWYSVNLAEATVGNIHLKKETPQDVADRERLREIDEELNKAAAPHHDSYLPATPHLPVAYLSAQ